MLELSDSLPFRGIWSVCNCYVSTVQMSSFFFSISGSEIFPEDASILGIAMVMFNHRLVCEDVDSKKRNHRISKNMAYLWKILQRKTGIVYENREENLKTMCSVSMIEEDILSLKQIWNSHE